MTVLAAGIALLSSLFFALGAALQQHEAARAAQPRLSVLLRRPRWLLAGASIAVGSGLHISALSVGPLTVVQPMGVASLLFALAVAAALHGRKPSWSELAAACVVGIGLTGLILLVPTTSHAPALNSTEAVTMLSGAALAALACFTVAKRLTAAGRTALLAIGAGVMYGAVATLTRALAGGTGWDLWLLAILPFPALAALMLLQRAYAIGHFAVAYATLQLADPLTAIACGALLLGEPLPTNTTAAVAAVLLATAGTFALARTTPMSR
ncbi:DMT family transporter [Sphaerisporangium sp. NPDC051017]|uniref:DMT family transporter n=1 Tax=Sphaerisporangium sp. NPDC051017 TaxID=3154636 RepID=UPI0034468FBB